MTLDLDAATIDLCVGWTKVAEVAGGRFAGVVRNLAAGQWRLEGAVDNVDLQTGYTLDDIDTIRLGVGSTLLFGGYVTPTIEADIGGLEIVTSETGARFALSGPDMWAVLASRVAYPIPSTGPPWVTSHDHRTGVASTVAAAYIDANLGSGALTERQIPNLTVVDGAAGTSGDWSARLQRLDELVARVCRDGGITCRPTVGFDGTVRIFVGGPVDRSDRIVLSDQGDLVNIQTRRVPPTVTYVIAGGQGELTSRTFATAGSGTGVARREMFSDQSSLATSTEVAQAATTALAFGGEAWSIRADLTTTGAQHLDFLGDYDVGDTLSVDVAGVRYPAVVTAVSFEISPQQKVIRPVLGDAAPNALVGLIRDIGNLRSRFDSQIA